MITIYAIVNYSGLIIQKSKEETDAKNDCKELNRIMFASPEFHYKVVEIQEPAGQWLYPIK